MSIELDGTPLVGKGLSLARECNKFPSSGLQICVLLVPSGFKGTTPAPCGTGKRHPVGPPSQRKIGRIYEEGTKVGSIEGSGT